MCVIESREHEMERESKGLRKIKEVRAMVKRERLREGDKEREGERGGEKT